MIQDGLQGYRYCRGCGAEKTFPGKSSAELSLGEYWPAGVPGVDTAGSVEPHHDAIL